MRMDCLFIARSLSFGCCTAAESTDQHAVHFIHDNNMHARGAFRGAHTAPLVHALHQLLLEPRTGTSSTPSMMENIFVISIVLDAGGAVNSWRAPVHVGICEEREIVPLLIILLLWAESAA